MTSLRIAFLFVLMICCELANAQNSDDLMGTWIVDMKKTINHIQGADKAKYDKMHNSTRDNINQSIVSRTYHFTDNHVSIDYTVSKGPQHAEGEWQYDKENKLLTITVGQRSKEYIVQWESKNTLLLVDKNAAVGNMIKTLYLIRKN